MVWPSCCDSGSSTMRAMMSTVLPALNGTTARIGLPAGQACARLKRGSAGVASAAAVAGGHGVSPPKFDGVRVFFVRRNVFMP
jgi:hypothetical protein